MNSIKKAAKVTCEIHKSLSRTMLDVLKKQGVEHVHSHSRRTLVLREQAALSFLPPTMGLDEDPAEVCEFYVPWEQAEQVLKTLSFSIGLSSPGKGSIYAEEVQLMNPDGLDFCNIQLIPGNGAESEMLLKKLACINCVVQRGLGNEIALHALEAGTNVPAISFGVGTGLRNKLGLIRITIPAEKEQVSMIINEHDRDEIMNSLIEAGRLDQPGRGFIGVSPVAMGVINSKTFRGKQRHSASMEQVIAAIDQLRHGAEWRKKTASLQSGSGMFLKKTFLTDMLNLVLVCNEGKSGDLVNAAMSAGAGGATISKIKYATLSANSYSVSPAREAISMGISPKTLEPILKAIEAIGAFDTETACIVETRPLPIACTYLGKK